MAYEGFELIAGLGATACAGALGALLWHTLATAPHQLWVLAVMVGLAFAIEFGFRAATGRELRLRLDNR